MGLCYEDREFAAPRRGGFDPSIYDPNVMYLKHFENSVYLKWIANNPRASWQEKRQAEKELAMAGRKCNYWRRVPGFDPARAASDESTVHAKWR